MSKSVRFICYTAMGVALVVVAQWLGSMLPAIAVITGPFTVKQLITGSLVNCILFVFTAVAGLGSAVTVGILSAVLASLIGVGPTVLPIVPLIALGNAILCVIYWLCAEKLKQNGIVSVIAAAAVKCGFLWVTVSPLLHALTGVPEKQVNMLSIMFSWPQGITALVGGALALIIISRLKSSK